MPTTRYAFTPELILRTPAQPFDPAVSEATLRAALADASFCEALYLASPVLHEECAKWQRGELADARKQSRLLATLARYYTRLRTRCTPFGLFAGCAVVAWGPGPSQVQLAAGQHRRHTRLDMHYLCALAQQLATHPALKPRLRYYPNSSLYASGQGLRYVEQHYHQGECVQQLSAIEAAEAVLAVLAAAAPGATAPALAAVLVPEAAADDEALAEAVDFVEELVQAQVLVSELAPTVTGVEYFAHLQAVLGRVLAEVADPAAQALSQVLEDVRQQLQHLDEHTANPAAAYERIATTLAPLGVPVEPGKLFQTDAVYAAQGPAPGAPATLDEALQATLHEALAVLACLAPPAHVPRLADFTRRFRARYEDREVPLLEALDAESGLAYAAEAESRYSALVHDLVLPEAAPAGPARRLSAAQRYLGQRLREAARSGAYCLDLTLAELHAQGLAPGPAPLPPSIGVLFRVIDAGRVLVEGADGSSAVNLLGRFAHAAPAIGDLIRQVTQAEQAHNPAVAFAEICHLPASRIGNLLQRPHFRALEIPYLAQSTLPAAGQVPVQDLRLAVHHGQLTLHAASTGQRLVPRLSTAHNFGSRQALPVYQFLCDLQTQGLQAELSFSWQSGAYPDTFLPRLTCGRAVLAAACWQLTAADLRGLLAAPPAEVAACLAAFRAQWQLPRYFTLADGDNELFVDAENELLVRVWLDAIRQRSSVLLKEFLFEPAASPVRDEAGRPYVPQFMAPLVRQAPCYPAGPLPGRPAGAGAAVTRAFGLGSEWLYYKLYCGPVVADRVLREAIEPLAKALRAQGLIDGWFFVRYADPDPHLRVRWHLPDPGRVGEVIQLVQAGLAPLNGDQGIWKTQTDTYYRELERYGARTIGCAEDLFCWQSQALLDHLAQAPADLPDDSWPWGLRAVDELLTAFGCSLTHKLALAQEWKTAFAHEFALNKDLKRQLDAKYRLLRPAVELALALAAGPAPAPLAAIARRVRAAEAHAPLEVPLDELLGSYVHMLLNRVLPADARLHELVLYDFLFRHYQACCARRPAAPAATSAHP
jgi:thiopeptide-type bacteriocin biosynthesis protein